MLGLGDCICVAFPAWVGGHKKQKRGEKNEWKS